MPSLATILIMILQVLPWGELIKLAIELIKGKQPDIDSGKLTTTQAREENIKAMQELTAMSPGVDYSVLLMVHQVAYMQYVQWFKPEKWVEWEAKMKDWAKHVGSLPFQHPNIGKVYANKFDEAVNKLYTSRPDQVKEDKSPVDSFKTAFEIADNGDDDQ